MTIKELLEDIELVRLDSESEVIVRDAQGNEYEIVCITDEDGKCEIFLD